MTHLLRLPLKAHEAKTTNQIAVLTIATLPRELKGAKVPDIVEIRGEIYLTAAEFERINAERAAAGTRSSPVASRVLPAYEESIEPLPAPGSRVNRRV